MLHDVKCSSNMFASCRPSRSSRATAIAAIDAECIVEVDFPVVLYIFSHFCVANKFDENLWSRLINTDSLQHHVHAESSTFRSTSFGVTLYEISIDLIKRNALKY